MGKLVITGRRIITEEEKEYAQGVFDRFLAQFGVRSDCTPEEKAEKYVNIFDRFFRGNIDNKIDFNLLMWVCNYVYDGMIDLESIVGNDLSKVGLICERIDCFICALDEWGREDIEDQLEALSKMPNLNVHE